MAEDDIKSEFGNYGEVENVDMLTDRATNEPKGFAYVKYRKCVIRASEITSNKD